MRIRVINMIAVIISIILVIVGIVVIIYSCVNDNTLVYGVGFIMVAFWLSFAALINGRSIYKQDNTELLMEKQTIEYVLENEPDYYIFEKAKEYNREINKGNNYFCRFNIEDRSKLEIDIYKYFNKDKEE